MGRRVERRRRWRPVRLLVLLTQLLQQLLVLRLLALLRQQLPQQGTCACWVIELS